MKKCQVCGTEVALSEPSCPSCGEASWSVIEAPPAPSEAPTKPSFAPAKKKGS